MTAVDTTAPETSTTARDSIRMEGVTKVYGKKPNTVVALADVSITLPSGSFTAVMGPSGSGKSTFLHCASGLDSATSGNVYLGETNVGALSEAERSRLRRQRIGFVFQAFNLIPSLSAAQNITLPLLLDNRRADRALVRAVVERMGLTERLRHRPAELSGGQQQRVAIARALVSQPEVLFADEPTGALDSRSGRQVLDLLRDAATELTQTVVMVTHDPVAASYADNVVFLADGRVVDTMVAPTSERVAERMTRLGG